MLPRLSAGGLTVHAWPVVFAAASQLGPLAWTSFKVGALSYGGGFVIIPLMQADAVDAYGWMTQDEFLNAVAFGQLTPGPVVQTVAAVGYAAAGLPGALLAAFVAFAPSFVFVIVLAPRFHVLRGEPERTRLPGRRRPGGHRRDPRRVAAAARRRAPRVAVGRCSRAPRSRWLLRRSAIAVLVGGLIAGVVAWALGAPV